MITPGTYGAKVQSWKNANPRDLLKSLIDEHPSAAKTTLLAMVRNELLEDRSADMLDSVIEYWFTNNYHSLVAPVARAPRPPREVVKAAQTAKVADIKSKVQARIQEEAQLLLLDLVMPNGKSLRDSTGKECAKAGGWYTKIAMRVPPGTKVGKALSEDQLRALWRTR